MTRAQNAPPIATQAHVRFNGLQRSIETDKKYWVVFTIHAEAVNVASTSLGSQNPMRQMDLQYSLAGVNYGSVDTRPDICGGYSRMFSCGLVDTRPDLQYSLAGVNYGSVDTRPDICGGYSRMFSCGLADTAPDSQAGIIPNWIIQYVDKQASSASQPTQGISEHTKSEDEMANMISSSQSMLTVSSSVFKDMRPLTDKERRYLGRFYNRAFKTR